MPVIGVHPDMITLFAEEQNFLRYSQNRMRVIMIDTMGMCILIPIILIPGGFP